MQVLSFARTLPPSTPTQTEIAARAALEPSRDSVQFGSKAKVQAYIKAQQELKTREFRQALSEPCVPAIPGAEAITGLDVLEAVREYLTGSNKALGSQFDVDAFLSKFLELDQKATEQNQLSMTLKKVLTEAWPRLGLAKYESRNYNYYLTLSADAVRVIESPQNEASAPEAAPAEGRSML